MSRIYLIWKKDFIFFMKSPMIYILMGLFSLLTGFMFYNLIVNYSQGLQLISTVHQSQISFVEEVVYRLFANINFLFLFFIPLISMKLMAEEKSSQTIDLLYQTPLKDYEIVMGKWFAGMSVMLVLLSVIIVYPIIIWGAGLNDSWLLVSCLLAILFNAALYMALGLFASSLANQVMLGALLGLVFILIYWMISWLGQISQNYLVSEMISYISITSHFEKLLRGAWGIEDIVYYISCLVFFLILTIYSLKRRWW